MGELGSQNLRIREAAKLTLKKFRRQTGHMLIEGARLVADALGAGAKVERLFATSAFLESDHGKAIRVCSGCECERITEAAAAKLSDTRTPQGIFAVVEFQTASLADALPKERKSPLVLVADGITDPGNLGTMIRSAAALGADCVVASGDTCDVTNPKCVRAAMGAIFRLPVVADIAFDSAFCELRSCGLQIVAGMPRGGKAPWSLDLTGPTALLIGSEAEGLPESVCAAADALATVPLRSGVESLNAAACAAALLYEAARQRATSP